MKRKLSAYLFLILVGFVMLLAGGPTAVALQEQAPTNAANDENDTATPLVYRMKLEGHMVNPATGDYIVNGIRKAQADGADAVLLRIDTPGGLLETTRQIVTAMLASEVPIITYVAPGGGRAGSAGVFLTMAGHVAAMAPGTNIGAASPVTGQGEDIEQTGGSDMARKVMEDTRAFVEAIAEERGRNAEWAAQAVTEAVSISYSRAVDLNVVDLLSDSDVELLNAVHGREVTVGKEQITLNTADADIVDIEMTTRQRFVDFLANPNIAYLLMTIGFLGIYFELANPGAIFPGVIGGTSLILAFVAMQVLPFNAGGLALMVLAIAMFIAELFVSSFGLLTVGGLISLVLGSLLLFETGEPGLRVDPGIIVGVVAAVGFSVAVASYLVAKTFGRKVETGEEGMIGRKGVALHELAPSGAILIDGERWMAVASQPIAEGQSVKVVDVDGLKLKVEPVVGE